MVDEFTQVQDVYWWLNAKTSAPTGKQKYMDCILFLLLQKMIMDIFLDSEPKNGCPHFSGQKTEKWLSSFLRATKKK
jgi:hypothetical protein